MPGAGRAATRTVTGAEPLQLYGLARSLLTDPLFWVVTLLAVGMLLDTRRPAAGRRWVLAGLVILVLLGWRLPSNAVMHQLETWYPLPTRLLLPTGARQGSCRSGHAAFC